ncbi:MAG: FKBP-type peptidyl-prolyl cis-trans isomerase [Muribaculaceae bacterium]|nr:FKBP-type peptidyl-prolyl cis-trans isomerase [Muribaculaceae bacterium]
MEKIEAGKYVELVYEIFVVNGEEQNSVWKFSEDKPDAFVFGRDLSLIEGFQNHIMGLEQGKKFDFTLKPEEAFGLKDPSLVYELEKEIFHVDGKFDSENIRVGAMVPMMTQEGMRIEGQVIKVTDDKVFMDFNHQLAGETVRYSGFVQVVRDATPEELQPHHGCGCGCEECGSGDCGHDHGCDCGGC